MFIKFERLSKIILIVLALCIQILFAQPETSEQIAVSFAPGDAAFFPQTFAANSKRVLPPISLKSVENAGKTWVADSIEIPVFEPEAVSGTSVAEKTERTRIGFIVPQLPRGNYEAFYEAVDGNDNFSSQKMLIGIAPVLAAQEAVVKGISGQVTEIKISLFSPYRILKGETQPSLVNTPITINIDDSSVAEFVAGQEKTVSTGSDGLAVWKLKINKAGDAKITAYAVGFEPTEIFIAAENDASRSDELKKAEADESQIKSQISRIENALYSEKGRSDKTFYTLLGESARTNTAISEEKEARITQSSNAETLESQLFEKTAQLSEIQNRIAVLKQTPFSPANLLPGDVLLTQSDTYLSEAIRFGEKIEIGEGNYSHASLYLGQVDGVPAVAEMLGNGYWVSPLNVSIAGTTKVGVYRWKGITPAKQREIAEIGGKNFGNAKKCFTSFPPDTLCGVPYAKSQITVLALAGAHSPNILIQRAAKIADNLSRGETAMICSEFVSRVYQKAGLDPQVNRWWSSLEAAGILSDDVRRKDYTTPNMLAVSPKFEYKGCLKCF